MKEEIYKTNNLISGLIGKQLKYFRPPYGVTTPVLAKAMKETGMVPVGWSVRTFDTTAKGDKEKILKKLKNIKSGDIILFHDHVDCLPEVLDQFISRIKSESYKIVPLNEMIKINAYE
jgi:peptidoglycan/xylan/chitin deacetylase (PgdA/CDA1 family)